MEPNLKLLIIEDDLMVAKHITNLISKCFSFMEVIVCTTIPEAIQTYNKETINIFLLDIQIGRQLVFDFLEIIRFQAKPIVFMSSFDTYSIQAINFRPFGYLLKPIDEHKLIKTIQECLTFIKSNRNTPQFNHLKINSNNKNHFIKPTEIMYIEADGAYSIIHKENSENITTSQVLKRIEESLNNAMFFRIHSKYLVNLNYIKTIHKKKGYYCELANMEVLTVSHRKGAKLLEVLSKI
ncbi:MAG: LytR/AlgR family response regulator transcription factor [Flavobacteriales bacterium]